MPSDTERLDWLAENLKKLTISFETGVRLEYFTFNEIKVVGILKPGILFNPEMKWNDELRQAIDKAMSKE